MVKLVLALENNVINFTTLYIHGISQMLADETYLANSNSYWRNISLVFNFPKILFYLTSLTLYRNIHKVHNVLMELKG